jgi:hypothetical protein
MTMNPTTFTWVDPTTNTDGSPLAAGEITGYTIGVRSSTAAGSVAGTYPAMTVIASATAVSEAVSALSTVLVPGAYAAAIRSNGPVNSAWSTETAFTILPPTPSAPTAFTAA